MPLLALLRHAEEFGTSAPGARVHTRGPRGISERGRAQAQAAARFLEPLAAQRVISSDARRAVETAEIIAAGRPVEIVPELAGLDLGDWDGLPLEEMPELAAVLSDPARRPPRGESLANLLERARPAFHAALSVDGDAIVVSHRMTNAVLLAEMMGLPPDHAGLILQDPTGINVIDRRGRAPAVAMLNVSPLDPMRLDSKVASLA